MKLPEQNIEETINFSDVQKLNGLPFQNVYLSLNRFNMPVSL
jgi:hypothetical protein